MKNLLKIIFVTFVLLGTVYANDVDVYKSGLVTVTRLDVPLCEEYDDLIAMGRKVVTFSYKLTVNDTFVGYFYFDQNDEYIGSYYEFGYPILFFGSLAQIKNDSDAPSFLKNVAKQEIKNATVSVDYSTDNFNKVVYDQVAKLQAGLADSHFLIYEN